MQQNVSSLFKQNAQDFTINVQRHDKNFILQPLNMTSLQQCIDIENIVAQELEKEGKANFIKKNSPSDYANICDDGLILGVFHDNILVAHASLLFPNHDNYNIGRGSNDILKQNNIGYKNLAVIKGARVPKHFQSYGLGLTLTAMRLTYAISNGKTHALTKLASDHTKNIENYENFGFIKEPTEPVIDPADNTAIFNLVCDLSQHHYTGSFQESVQKISEKRIEAGNIRKKNQCPPLS